MEFKEQTMEGITLFLKQLVLGTLMGISLLLCFVCSTNRGRGIGGKQIVVSKVFQ